MKTMKANNIREYFENEPQDLLDICRQINAYDGSMGEFDTWDIEELANSGITGYDLARAIIYGDVDDVMHDVRFDCCGNLESVYDCDLESTANDYMQDVIDLLMDGKATEYQLTLSEELENILSCGEDKDGAIWEN